MKFDQKAYLRAYYLAHCELLRRRSREYYLANKDKVREYSKEYQAKHYDQHKKNARKWYLDHQELTRERARVWRLENIEAWKVRASQYQKSPKGKEAKKKTKSVKRNLGFITLNKYFEGSHSHHINKERVIYIPAKMHNGTSHSLLRNKNMEKINKISFDYLEAERL